MMRVARRLLYQDLAAFPPHLVLSLPIYDGRAFLFRVFTSPVVGNQFRRSRFLRGPGKRDIER